MIILHIIFSRKNEKKIHISGCRRGVKTFYWFYQTYRHTLPPPLISPLYEIPQIKQFCPPPPTRYWYHALECPKFQLPEPGLALSPLHLANDPSSRKDTPWIAPNSFLALLHLFTAFEVIVVRFHPERVCGVFRSCSIVQLDLYQALHLNKLTYPLHCTHHHPPHPASSNRNC